MLGVGVIAAFGILAVSYATSVKHQFSPARQYVEEVRTRSEQARAAGNWMLVDHIKERPRQCLQELHDASHTHREEPVDYIVEAENMIVGNGQDSNIDLTDLDSAMSSLERSMKANTSAVNSLMRVPVGKRAGKNNKASGDEQEDSDFELESSIKSEMEESIESAEALVLDRKQHDVASLYDDNSLAGNLSEKATLDGNQSENTESWDASWRSQDRVIEAPPFQVATDEFCSMAYLDEWAAHTEAQRVFRVWKYKRPEGRVFAIDEDHSCLARGLTKERMGQPIKANAQVLDLVHKSGEVLCAEVGEPWQEVKPSWFKLPDGPILRKGHGVHRNYGIVWPVVGVCDVGSPCPVVVFLSGIGEHSDQMSLNTTFNTIQKFGMLRYLQLSKYCFKRLGSLYLFPELDRNENWLHDGKNAINDFVVPLVEYMNDLHTGLLDMHKVSIIGYSEGAFGALQAAAHRPDFFALAVGASLSTSPEFWKQMPAPKPKDTVAHGMDRSKFKLRTVMVALGEHDTTGDQGVNVNNILKWIDASTIADTASLEIRYYVGLYHKEVWERLFNRWHRFHEVFWKGNYAALDAPDKA